MKNIMKNIIKLITAWILMLIISILYPLIVLCGYKFDIDVRR